MRGRLGEKVEVGQKEEEYLKNSAYLSSSLVTPRGLISQRVRIPPVSCLLLTVALLQDTALW